MPARSSPDPLQPGPELRARLDRLGFEFLADFHGLALRHRPDDPAQLAELAHALTLLGRHEEGLRVDRRLAALVPEDSTVHYNLACSLALCGDPAAALDELERAVELGYEDADPRAAEDDLASLNGEPRFEALLAGLRASTQRGPPP